MLVYPGDLFFCFFALPAIDRLKFYMATAIRADSSEFAEFKGNDYTKNHPRGVTRFFSNRFVEDRVQNNSSNFNNDANEGNADEGGSFASLLNSSPLLNVKEGDIIEGIVRRVTDEDVIIDVNLKSEGRVPIKEFRISEGFEINVGDKVKVCVEKIEGKSGSVILSRDRAIKSEALVALEQSLANQQSVEGVIFSPTRGGCIVDIQGIVAFLPSSHIDLKPVKDLHPLLGKKEQFMILKIDKLKGNIVVSRRAVLEASNAVARKEFLKTLDDGDIIVGKVKSITPYGVFIGIHESKKVGVVDGLLHVTDIAWSRVPHPSAIYSCGQEVRVVVTNVNHESGRVSLGAKQLEGNPWENIEERCPVGSLQKGIVSTIEDYGAFVELEAGVEGLVHISEISWVKSNLPISKLISRGQEVIVKVLSIDTEKNRMSLSMKYCTENPWQIFAEKHAPGTIVSGKVKTVVDFGIFVNLSNDVPGLTSSMDGLVHLSDLSWNNPEEEIKNYKPGMEVTAKVLRINSARGRVCLGIKQCEYDPFVDFLRSANIGDVIPAAVEKIEDGLVFVSVGNGVGSIPIDKEYLPDGKRFSIGERVNAEILAIGSYDLLLSIK